MAKKKKAPARRRTARRAAPARRSPRRAVKKAGIGISVRDLAMGVVGGMLADAYGDKIPIDDPGTRNLVLAGGAAFAAMKGPRELAPLFVGASLVGGIRAANHYFPELLPKNKLKGGNYTLAEAAGGGGTGVSTGNNGRLTAAAPSSQLRTIGRRSQSEQDQIRRAVEWSLRERGQINGSINGTINGRRRGSIFS